jgi:hypothetical protein
MIFLFFCICIETILFAFSGNTVTAIFALLSAVGAFCFPILTTKTKVETLEEKDRGQNLTNTQLREENKKLKERVDKLVLDLDLVKLELKNNKKDGE